MCLAYVTSFSLFLLRFFFTYLREKERGQAMGEGGGQREGQSDSLLICSLMWGLNPRILTEPRRCPISESLVIHYG